MISDNNFFMEVKKNYGASMVTGFIRLNGSTVGCVANRSEVYENGEKVQTLEAALCGKGCEKATDFINFCDAFSIPVLTLVNVNGYRATMCSERKIAKLAAKLTYAYADATVPKELSLLRMHWEVQVLPWAARAWAQTLFMLGQMQ